MTHNSSQRGFTLIETLVALALILMALVGPISLITRGIYSFSSSKSEVIAVNLAQEGIELIRLIRENNIACDRLNGVAPWAWNRGSSPPAGPGSAMSGTTLSVDISSFVRINCPSEVQSIMTPALGASCAIPLRFDESTGTYSYSGSGNPTVFSRCIEVKSPPDSPDTGDTPPIPPRDQMDIVSTVSWQERGRTRIVTLRERLYHWE